MTSSDRPAPKGLFLSMVNDYPPMLDSTYVTVMVRVKQVTVGDVMPGAPDYMPMRVTLRELHNALNAEVHAALKDVAWGDDREVSDQ